MNNLNDSLPVSSDYIPFGKPLFNDEECGAVCRILHSGWIGMGPETISFEKELSEYVHSPQMVTTNSCTSALFLSLLVHGIGPGDEVICPSLTWCSSANVALYLGAKVVFCDIDPSTLCVNAETVSRKITEKTKAVIIVHYGGLAINIEEIRQILPDHVAIVEDAAHAFGSLYPDGTPVGSSGNLTCFSFYANKNLSTAEGGAIAVSDIRIAERLRSLRLHGLPIDAWMRYSQPKILMLSPQLSYLGYKFNYTDLQAAIGRIQLKKQEDFACKRSDIARIYHDSLSGIPGILFQKDCLSEKHAKHLFLIQLPLHGSSLSRDEIIIELRNRNIGASIHYAPLHLMPLYGHLGSLPVTEDVSRKIITLPISPSMTVDEAGYISRHLIDILYQTSVRES